MKRSILATLLVVFIAMVAVPAFARVSNAQTAACTNASLPLNNFTPETARAASAGHTYKIVVNGQLKNATFPEGGSFWGACKYALGQLAESASAATSPATVVQQTATTADTTAITQLRADNAHLAALNTALAGELQEAVTHPQVSQTGVPVWLAIVVGIVPVLAALILFVLWRRARADASHLSTQLQAARAAETNLIAQMRQAQENAAQARRFTVESLVGHTQALSAERCYAVVSAPGTETKLVIPFTFVPPEEAQGLLSEDQKTTTRYARAPWTGDGKPIPVLSIIWSTNDLSWNTFRVIRELSEPQGEAWLKTQPADLTNDRAKWSVEFALGNTPDNAASAHPQHSAA